jgi:hypothetical protein
MSPPETRADVAKKANLHPKIVFNLLEFPFIATL